MGNIHEFKKKFKILNWEIILDKRSRHSFMGRFGGGWNWKLGFQAGGGTLIISLLVMDLILRKDSK
jgi:hypothetical protein